MNVLVVALILQYIVVFAFADIDNGGSSSESESSGEVQRRLSSAVSLNYYGGPILTSVNLVPIFYNSDVRFQGNIKNYYNALITGGDFVSFIDGEYGVDAVQKIDFGTVEDPFIGTETNLDISDTQIRNLIEYSFSADPLTLQLPSENTLYAVHLPPSSRVSDPFHTYSCQMWCSYHSSFQSGTGHKVYYIVVPDISGDCSIGCGQDPDPINNLYSVISSEVAEAITNPAVGLATGIAPPLSWWSPIFGEVADPCGDSQGKVTLGDGKRYVVHYLWSNSAGACVKPA